MRYEILYRPISSLCTRSKSGVAVSTSTRAGTGSPRSLPSARHGATRTRGLRRTRRTFAECRSVSANSRLPSDTNHSGVATPVPSRLKLVRLRYRPGKTASTSAAGRSTGRSIVWVAIAISFPHLSVLRAARRHIRHLHGGRVRTTTQARRSPRAAVLSRVRSGLLDGGLERSIARRGGSCCDHARFVACVGGVLAG